MTILPATENENKKDVAMQGNEPNEEEEMFAPLNESKLKKPAIVNKSLEKTANSKKKDF